MQVPTTDSQAKGRWSLAIGLASGLFLLGSVAHAQSAEKGEDSPWQFSGFSTLGLAHHNNSTLGLIASQGQLHPAEHGWSPNLDSVLGGQVDYRLSATTQLVAQAALRPGYDKVPQVRMAFARQRLGGDLTLRLGRLRNPMFFDSDVSEIGYANLAVRPAIPIYIIANSVPTLDGLDLQWRAQLNSASLLMQGYYGNARPRQQFYDQSESGQQEFRDIRGLAASLAWPNWTVRVSKTLAHNNITSPSITQFYSGVNQLAGGMNAMAAGLLANPYTAILGQQLQAQAGPIAGLDGLYRIKPSYTSAGFDGTAGNWRLSGELVELDTHSAMLGRFRGFQLTAGYTWGAWTPYAGRSGLYRKTALFDSSLLSVDLPPVLPGAAQINGYAAQLRAGLDQSSQTSDISSHSSTLGVRWEAAERMAVKFQWDRIRSPSPNANGPFAVRMRPFDNGVSVFSISIDAVF